MRYFDYYIFAWKNFANFKGRARRAEYGWFSLFNFLISIGLGLVDGGNGVFSGLYGLAGFIPTIAVVCRRRHDLGLSGWWQAAPVGAIILGIVLMLSQVLSPNTVSIFLVLVVLMTLVFNFWIIFKDGQPHTNRFGINPKGKSESHSDTNSLVV
ncbi:DUF805 domain-containing protein [Pasteurella testudinis]|uniref:DUF805 domain-containing protein n=1 Tax=Pasteurella testudinis TaxID=761 RepID=UPI004058745A